MSGNWAIVPVKRLEHAKSRLALVLDAQERRQLVRAMLSDVLDTLLRVSQLDGIVVVTSDGEVSRLARQAGAHLVPDIREAGTNEAVRQGLAWLGSQQNGCRLIMPADIPFLTPGEVANVISSLRSHDVALVPALRDGGTNILGLRCPARIEAAFGEESFARHLAAARAAAITPAILDLDGAGHDIDVPTDLFHSSGGEGGARTRAVLSQLSCGNPVPVAVWMNEELES
ncbi:2-phospho-L-lactate guanylyltransferase [Pseudohoeflea suaedae]|uniref:3-phospho-D-glycerate guanylyltransferase n=1 Tax=Pseudohoeflea suaedae TaxID=877384 RepID=A0A4R5PK26_9HYPH|nr:2-phospho-L-lactate guanylyltransferase [Pseudohoeflea suaedae]TDH35170.1 2-phospho-L-lactate guanylyltransferase [Pseudohoeflea suaedae]